MLARSRQAPFNSVSTAWQQTRSISSRLFSWTKAMLRWIAIKRHSLPTLLGLYVVNKINMSSKTFQQEPSCATLGAMLFISIYKIWDKIAEKRKQLSREKDVKLRISNPHSENSITSNFERRSDSAAPKTNYKQIRSVWGTQLSSLLNRTEYYPYEPVKKYRHDWHEVWEHHRRWKPLYDSLRISVRQFCRVSWYLKIL